MVDTRALRARDANTSWRFESSPRHSYFDISGCGSVGRALLLGSRGREFESRHPDISGYSLMVEREISNLSAGVRFSLPAQLPIYFLKKMVAVAQLVRARVCGT